MEEGGESGRALNTIKSRGRSNEKKKNKGEERKEVGNVHRGSMGTQGKNTRWERRGFLNVGGSDQDRASRAKRKRR